MKVLWFKRVVLPKNRRLYMSLCENVYEPRKITTLEERLEKEIKSKHYWQQLYVEERKKK